MLSTDSGSFLQSYNLQRVYGVISKLSLRLLAAYDPTARRGRERQVLRQFQCIPTEEKRRAGDSGKQSLPDNESVSRLLLPGQEEDRTFPEGHGSGRSSVSLCRPSEPALGPFLQTDQATVLPLTYSARPPTAGPGFREGLPNNIKGSQTMKV